MINELSKIANELDCRGLTNEADALDLICKKALVNPITWWQERGVAGGLDEFADEAAPFAGEALDWTQVILDAAGLVPGAGNFFDIANTAISTLRNNPTGAVLSAISALPAGDIVGKGLKVLLNAIKKGLTSMKVGAATISIMDMAHFLLGKLAPLNSNINYAVAALDRKAGTREFTNIWNNTIMAHLRAAAA